MTPSSPCRILLANQRECTLGLKQWIGNGPWPGCMQTYRLPVGFEVEKRGLDAQRVSGFTKNNDKIALVSKGKVGDEPQDLY